MKTIRVDIIDEKVLDTLKSLEILELIRLHEDKEKSNLKVEHLKGVMIKQPLDEVNNQLQNLRNA